jgi:AbrB family looped-hinge helix DNA binding protein
MKTTTMTVKGQVTVPKEFRDAFGLKPGERVDFVAERDGVKIVKARRRRKGAEIVERLRRAPWNPSLSTRRLMKLTRHR